MEKYGKDLVFNDPVLRCDKCKKLILRSDLTTSGMCSGCGNRKVGNVMGFGLFEYLKMRFWWKVDPDFLKIFTSKKRPCEKASI